MAYEKTETFQANPAVLPQVVKYVKDTLEIEGYTVSNSELANGSIEMSVTKGGVFKTIAGLKTALKVSLRPVPPGDKAFVATVKVGLFETQGVPTAISMLVFWPLIITQIVGYVNNTKLDTRIMGLIKAGVESLAVPQAQADIQSFVNTGKFCPNCGKPVSGNFCSECGAKIV